MDKKLLLIDGNALIYRAYHAFPKELTTPDGKPSGAIYGFSRILFSTIKTLKPTHLAVAFDLPGGTFRHEKYPAYKGTRSETPEDLLEQMPLAHTIVETMEAPVYTAKNFEADDVLGTIARTIEQNHKDVEVIILSPDQDLLQLTTDQTHIYSPAIGFQKSATLFTPEKVQEKYGFTPLQMVDYKALRGDPSDNIPGVKGIGEVTAKQLLAEFKNIGTLYEALHKGPLKDVKAAVQTKLTEHEADAHLSYDLATISREAPITFDLDKCRLELLNPEKLVDLFRKFNFKSLLDELPGSHKLAAAAADVFSAEEEKPAEPPKGDLSLSEKNDEILAPILRKMEETGVTVDTKYLKKLETEFDGEIQALVAKLHEEAGQPFNPDSPQQIGYILYEVMQIPTKFIRKGKTGFTTDADTLNKLAEEHPIAKTILTYRELTKLQSTYIKPLQEMVDEHSRIHTNYAPDTATGRISSRNPNLQNIPVKTEQGKRIRQAFVAEKGYKLLAADYSQFELRIAAHLSGDQGLIDAFNKGGDFHAETAAKMGVDRRTAKMINFSILYGKGAFGFSNDLGVSMEEARNYIDQYFKTFPTLRTYLDQVLADTRTRGYGETMYGRKRMLPEITASNYQHRAAAEREALNLPIQGSQADILKKAMIDLDNRLKSSKSGARLILTVHDELVLEVPEKEVGETAKLLVETMVNAEKLVVPVIVEAKVGDNWAEMEPLEV